MTGADLIKYIRDSKSENAEGCVYSSDGMIKGADTFAVTHATDEEGKRHLAIMIE